MLFILSIFFSFNTFPVVEKTQINTNGHFFNSLELAEIQPDGSIIIPNTTKVFHISKKGNIINQFGKKGNGPGEFMLIIKGYWSGTHYLVTDSRRRDISFFNSHGEFIKRELNHLRLLFPTNNGYLAVDNQKIIGKSQPIYLAEILDKPNFVRKTEGFHYVPEIIERFGFNFANFYATAKNSETYVIDEMRQHVTVYDMNFKETNTHNLTLKHFVEAEVKWSDSWSRKKILRHIFTFSRITSFWGVDEGLAISYTAPNPNNPDEQLNYLSIVNLSGKVLSKDPLLVKDSFIGSHNNLLYFIHEDEDGNFFIITRKFLNT